MIIDLTCRPDPRLVEPWLEKEENRHLAAGHLGSHLDSYLASPIPLDYFRCRGVLLDASGFAEEREIGLGDLDLDEVKPGDFVLFRTDRIKKTYGRPEYFKDHPCLSQELIEALCQKKIAFIGIDAPGIRRGQEHEAADIYCEKNQVYVIENLDQLHKISQKNPTIYTMWLEDDQATGLRCRVLCEEK